MLALLCMATNKRIIYTRHDGGVSVCEPSQEVFRAMQFGGYWDHMPRGYVDVQIQRQIEAGHHPDAARRFARAVAFGGAAEWECWEIIRDRDCGHLGILHELQSIDDLPDRYFRNAWARSSNGGPVVVNLEKAKPLQWEYVRRAVQEETKRREESFEELPALQIPWNTIRSAIKYARDDSELRRIWPDGIERQ